MVSLILEKYAYHIWQTDKFMFLGVFHDVIAYFTEPSRIIIVIRVIDDYLLSEYRSVQFESQYLSQRITVQIHIEYHRVVVGFVCEEHRQRCQHGSGDTLTEPYCPHSSTCHSVSGIVKDVEYDKHQYGYDDRYSQSTFPDNGSEWGADKEKYEARQSQNKLVDRLYLMLADGPVPVRGRKTLVFEHTVYHFRPVEGGIENTLFFVGRQVFQHFV